MYTYCEKSVHLARTPCVLLSICFQKGKQGVPALHFNGSLDPQNALHPVPT